MVNETFTSSDTELDDVLLSTVAVAERIGRAVQTVINWAADDAVGFPRPRMIRRKRYFSAAELARWERRFPDRLGRKDAA